MADNVQVGNTTGGPDDYVVASEELAGGEQLQSVELHTEAGGVKAKVDAANPLAVALGTPASLTGSAPLVASVGVASDEAVAANASRKGLILVNNSDNVISLAFGAPAVLNSGITLQPGGSWTMTRDTFTTQQIRAIASIAASPLGVQEFQ